MGFLDGIYRNAKILHEEPKQLLDNEPLKFNGSDNVWLL